MNRTLSALFSALEAVIVVAVGLAIPLIPLTILWGAQYGFGPDWTNFWRLSADAWLLGHGADITVTLNETLVKALGIPGAAQPFVLSIAILGFSLVTVLLARRAGKRIAETRHRLSGEVVALLVVLAASFAISFSAVQPGVRPSVVQGTILPTLVFALGLAIARIGDLPWFDRIRDDVRLILVGSLRAGMAAVAIVVTVAAILVALMILANYAQIITLYESLHTGALGGTVLTIAQIMFLPNLVIWASAWLIGPGFAIGTGSSVSPLATNLGPVPSIPVLGALPQGDLPFAFVGLVVPIVAGFLAGALLSKPEQLPVSRLTWTLAVGVGTGIVGGAVLGVLAWASAGSLGPGRLADVGPDPVAVGLLAALELGLSAIVGMAATRR